MGCQQIWSLELNCHGIILVVKMPCLQNLFPSRRGVWAPVSYVSPEQRFYGVNYNTEGAPVAKGLPEELGHRHWRLRQKNDGDRNTLTTGISLRVHNFQAVESRQNLDANQSN